MKKKEQRSNSSSILEPLSRVGQLLNQLCSTYVVSSRLYSRSQKIVFLISHPTFAAKHRVFGQLILLIVGVGFLAAGALWPAEAQSYIPRANYNDHRIAEAADVALTFLTGSFGALVMTFAGVSSIISGAFGQYRASLSLMVVSIGSFILRSLISTWFNDRSMRLD
jgi:hypothetical protein